MSDGVQTSEIVWAGITIEVKFTRNWMSGIVHHLELRSDEPVSVTETGYKSHFIPYDEDLRLCDIIAFVVSWLDKAADTKNWRDYVEAQRQGDLFDL